MGVRVGVAYSRDKLELKLKSQFSIFDFFRDIRVHIYVSLEFSGGLCALK